MARSFCSKWAHIRPKYVPMAIANSACHAPMCRVTGEEKVAKLTWRAGGRIEAWT